MTTTGSGFVEGAALVAGRAAAVIARTMRDAIAQQRKRDGVGQIAPDLLVAIEAMERAGQHWASASGRTEAHPAEIPAPSPHDVLDTAQAAIVLGVTDRRVRQLVSCGELAPAAVKPYRFDAVEVLAMKERRAHA